MTLVLDERVASGVGRELAAGTYASEKVDGPSPVCFFLAYRRASTGIVLSARGTKSRQTAAALN